MTIIVYRDGVMASDTGAWSDGSCHPWARKIIATVEGLFGLAGDGAAISDWLRAKEFGGDLPRIREVGDGRSTFIIMSVFADSPEYVNITSYNGVETYRAPYYAIGASAQCAFGALFAGASAEDAVEACIMHGCNANGDIDAVEFIKS